MLAAMTTLVSPGAAMPSSPADVRVSVPVSAARLPAGTARATRGWPLDPAPAVVRSFHAPPTPWSPGHRGVDLIATGGQPVLAPRAGRVTFVGVVAGRGVVVVTHPGGLRTSYEPVVAGPPVGTVVGRGDRIAVLAATPGHCAPASCLHWGLRRGDVYVDPLLLVGAGPPVLKPVAGGRSLRVSLR